MPPFDKDVGIEVENVLREAIARMGADTRGAELGEIDVDSLQLVEFALVAEEAWGVDLRPTELDGLHTVGDVADLIVSRLG